MTTRARAARINEIAHGLVSVLGKDRAAFAKELMHCDLEPPFLVLF